MTVWDLRQLVESAIPWWLPFGVLLVVAVVAVVLGWREGRREPWDWED